MGLDWKQAAERSEHFPDPKWNCSRTRRGLQSSCFQSRGSESFSAVESDHECLSESAGPKRSEGSPREDGERPSELAGTDSRRCHLTNQNSSAEKSDYCKKSPY